MSIVWGIDAGGTKTLAIGFDEQGHIVSLIADAGVDPTSTANPRAQLEVLADKVLAESAERPSAATFGLPYHGEIPAVTEMQNQVVTQKFGASSRACNDVEAAHIGAFSGDDGVLCLAGTGAMAWAKGPHGVARSSGFGDLIGDEGSAYAIGRHALAELSKQIDGRAPRTSFQEALLARLGIAADELIGWVYSQEERRPRIAGVARYVSQIAENGEPLAISILKTAGQELALAAQAAARNAGLSSTSNWSFAGSVFSDAVVRAEVTRVLGSDPLPCKFPPVGGAVIDAAQNAGWDVNESWMANLRNALKQKAIS